MNRRHLPRCISSFARLSNCPVVTRFHAPSLDPRFVFFVARKEAMVFHGRITGKWRNNLRRAFASPCFSPEYASLLAGLRVMPGSRTSRPQGAPIVSKAGKRTQDGHALCAHAGSRPGMALLETRYRLRATCPFAHHSGLSPIAASILATCGISVRTCSSMRSGVLVRGLIPRSS